ncbi:hypothetical protein, partial [Streptococcus sobrinus]|uniref:hypothetical protein n=1 Tax=Streptococcus sobrinus TaxID=1310 RepID=UPI000496BD25
CIRDLKLKGLEFRAIQNAILYLNYYVQLFGVTTIASGFRKPKIPPSSNLSGVWWGMKIFQRFSKSKKPTKR